MKLVIIKKPSEDSSRGTEGVDMLAHPLSLGNAKFASAVNMQFSNGVIKTRPAFRYESLGLQGVFQGATFFSPSKGISSKIFASEETGLALAVSGKLFISATGEGHVSCPAQPLCGDYCFPCGDDVHLFGAEDWLVAQSFTADTVFWNGLSCARTSPGMKEPDRERSLNCAALKPESFHPGGISPTSPEAPEASRDLEEIVPGSDNKDSIMEQYRGDCLPDPEDSHDSFQIEKREQWLVNGAGLGVYAHARIHQQTPFAVFVGDILHKRGFTSTDDLLSMEEQALESFGDPLVWPSSMGKMMALRLLPQNRTANGQGSLVAYFAGGIMTFNTFQFPRESRVVDGRQVAPGWGDKQMSEHAASLVSAVGRYAVTDLITDHVFRSTKGLHYLRSVVGDKSEKTEQIDIKSHEVKPLLCNRDEETYLSGTTIGFWSNEDRIFCSTGMGVDGAATSSTMGKGFVSYNQATRFTDDETPIPVWEGLWLPNSDVKGIHYFTHIEDFQLTSSFGFICSDNSNQLMFGFLEPDKLEDEVLGKDVPIEWSVETSQFVQGSYDQEKTLKDGRLEVYVQEGLTKGIRVYARSNRNLEWQLWKDVDLSEVEGYFHLPVTLGAHPGLKSATWFQVRIEGLGFCEIDYLAVDHAPGKTKSGNGVGRMVKTSIERIYETVIKPATERWTTNSQ